MAIGCFVGYQIFQIDFKTARLKAQINFQRKCFCNLDTIFFTVSLWVITLYFPRALFCFVFVFIFNKNYSPRTLTSSFYYPTEISAKFWWWNENKPIDFQHLCNELDPSCYWNFSIYILFIFCSKSSRKYVSIARERRKEYIQNINPDSDQNWIWKWGQSFTQALKIGSPLSTLLL